MSYRRVARAALTPALPLLPAGRRLRQRASREHLILRLKLAALAVGGAVEVDIADDVDIRGPVRVEVYPGTWSAIRLSSGVTIGDNVRLSMRGGLLSVGAGTQLRRFGTYQVAGELRVGGGVVLSNGVVVHCAERMCIDDLSIIGEYCTLTDSTHERTAGDDPIHHTTSTSPLRIGRNVWVGAHAVIAKGVTVGDRAVVGAAAVVTSDAPAGWLVAGVPARPIRDVMPKATATS